MTAAITGRKKVASVVQTHRRGRSQRNTASILIAALVGFAVSTSAVSARAAESSNAWAAGLKNLTPEQGQTLLKIAHDLFPRDELADSKFTACIDPYDTAASDPQAKQAVEDALGMAEGAARRMGYKAYTDISDDDERERLAKMLAEGRWMRQFKKSLDTCLKADMK
jgi:hypothetical protein